MRMTLESVALRPFLIPIAAAVLTVGCGGQDVPQTPTAPTATLDSPAFLTGDVADGTTTEAAPLDALNKGGNGKGNGNGGGKGAEDKDKGKDKDKSDDVPSPANPGQGGGSPANPGQGGGGGVPVGGGPGGSHEDRVVGFVAAKFGDILTVNGIAVVARVGAVIRHGNRTLTMADIEVGDHVQARGTMEGTTLAAVEIKVQDTGRDNDDADEVELVGTISALSSTATCPVVTFMIGVTRVTTSPATVFEDVTCATLANNARVEVKGIRQPDGSVLATKVEAEAGPAEVEGFVFEFSGPASCPTATFRVGPILSLATRVTTTASTSFSSVTCATLANGARVEVEGTKQADGSITAASVRLR